MGLSWLARSPVAGTPLGFILFAQQGLRRALDAASNLGIDPGLFGGKLWQRGLEVSKLGRVDKVEWPVAC